MSRSRKKARARRQAAARESRATTCEQRQLIGLALAAMFASFLKDLAVFSRQIEEDLTAARARQHECDKLADQVELTVRRAVLDVAELEGFLQLQNLIDAVKRRYPDLYDATKINGVINGQLRTLWGESDSRRGTCPHVRAGFYRRVTGMGSDPNAPRHWYRATIVGLKKLREATIIKVDPRLTPSGRLVA